MKIEHDIIAKKTTEWYDRLYLGRYYDACDFTCESILESLLLYRQWLKEVISSIEAKRVKSSDDLQLLENLREYVKLSYELELYELPWRLMSYRDKHPQS